jgi:hypothetical protein
MTVDRAASRPALASLVALTLAAALGGSFGCTKSRKKVDEPVQPALTPKAGDPGATGSGTGTGTATGTGTGTAPQASMPPPPIDDACKVYPKMLSEPPLWLPGKDVVLTRMMKPCITPDGQRGYDQASPWLAMGFPCTGGSGRVDVKGHYHNPKMIGFILGTDCAMAPSTKEVVQTIVQPAFDLPPESKALAYTPFVVQFWEIPGMTDADVGFTLELRSPAALDGLWRKMREKKEPIPVKLYGRENAWVQGGAFFAVEGELRLIERTGFKFVVSKVTALTTEQIAEVAARCEALRPKRNCGDVF